MQRKPMTSLYSHKSSRNPVTQTNFSINNNNNFKTKTPSTRDLKSNQFIRINTQSSTHFSKQANLNQIPSQVTHKRFNSSNNAVISLQTLQSEERQFENQKQNQQDYLEQIESLQNQLHLKENQIELLNRQLQDPPQAQTQMTSRVNTQQTQANTNQSPRHFNQNQMNQQQQLYRQQTPTQLPSMQNSQLYQQNLYSKDILNVTCNSFPEEQEKLVKILQSLIEREQEMTVVLKQRCERVQDIINIFTVKDDFQFESEKDFVKFKESINQLSQSLYDASKTEIDLGQKIRECERANIEVSKSQHTVKTYLEKNLQLQKIIDLVRQKNTDLCNENNQLLRKLNIEKKTSNNNQKKVSNLEKRVEFILENDINSSLNPNDKLRTSLNELLRENESLKRDITHKNQEIERQFGTIAKLNNFIKRLNGKIENIKKLPGQSLGGETLSGNPQQTANETTKFYKKDDIDLLHNFLIPPNLDFKVMQLNSDNINILSDIQELGPVQFCNQVIQKEDKLTIKQILCLVSNQFLSYKDLCTKLNQLLREIQDIFQKNLEVEFMIREINNNLRVVYNAERVFFWVLDNNTGLLYTYNGQFQKKCLINKGIVGELFYYKTPLNVKNAKTKPLLYLLNEQTNKDEPFYVDTTLLLPVFINKEKTIKGFIEISNNYHELFSFDEEYLGIIFAKFLGQYMQNYIDKQVVLTELKYKEMILQSFDHLCYSVSKENFTKQVKQWIAIIFGIQSSIFYFVEKEKLVLYEQEQLPKEFSLDHGIAGLVAQQRRGYIVSDVKLSSLFNNLVDISTVLPIYVFPLLEKSELEPKCIGVVEIVLKNQFQSKFERDTLIDPYDGCFGPEQPFNNQLNCFTTVVAQALRNTKFMKN